MNKEDREYEQENDQEMRQSRGFYNFLHRKRISSPTGNHGLES